MPIIFIHVDTEPFFGLARHCVNARQCVAALAMVKTLAIKETLAVFHNVLIETTILELEISIEVVVSAIF